MYLWLHLYLLFPRHLEDAVQFFSGFPALCLPLMNTEASSNLGELASLVAGLSAADQGNNMGINLTGISGQLGYVWPWVIIAWC